MNVVATDLLSRYEKAVNKKRLLFKLQLTNLCVKADPMSLLSMKVPMGEDVVNVEVAADVVRKDDYTFILIPHEGCTIESLTVAVTQVHPEFKQTYLTAKMAEGSDETMMLLRLVMPDVDKNRHDVLMQGVDTFADAINKAIDADKAFYSAKIALYMLEATPEEQDEVSNKLDEGANTCKDMVTQDADKKKQEIEDAYTEYQATHDEKKGLKDIKAAADAMGEDVANSMKME